MPVDFFKISKKDSKSSARTGVINTAHGQVATPAFLPIGTRGSVKTVTNEELKFWGAEMILANTYHLWLRPGDTLINKAGGIHKFIGWDGPIFTDSGGFQVFSLGEKRDNAKNAKEDAKTAKLFPPYNVSRVSHYNIPILKRISRAGVEFQDELGGLRHVLTPEGSVQIQSNLGSDVALVLDDVPALPAAKKRLQESLELTLHWAERARAHHDKITATSVNPGQKLYGIVQGGDDKELRKKSAEGLQKIGFEGYAIGGLAVGESPEVMYRALADTTPHLEEDKPRHLLGVGYPEQIIRAVSLGIDTFDCVLPTRNARHGQLFIDKKLPSLRANSDSRGNPGLVPSDAGDEGIATLATPRNDNLPYEIININNEQFKEDFTPVDNTCSCYGCLNHNRAYIRHLFKMGEPLGIRLATMHNLRFYLDLMARIRRAIEFDSFEEMLKEFTDK